MVGRERAWFYLVFVLSLLCVCVLLSLYWLTPVVVLREVRSAFVPYSIYRCPFNLVVGLDPPSNLASC